MSAPVRIAPARGGSADVVYVLLLLQAAAGLLAMTGLLLLMGNPLYAVAPVLKAVALFVLAAKIVRGRLWALVTTIVLEWLGVLGVWLGVLIGLFPGLDPAMTVTGLLTELGLPIAVIWLCARLLASSLPRRRALAPASTLPAQTLPLPTVVYR